MNDKNEIPRTLSVGKTKEGEILLVVKEAGETVLLELHEDEAQFLVDELAFQLHGVHG